MGRLLTGALLAAALSIGVISSAADAAVLTFSTGKFTSGTAGRSNIAAGDFTDTLTFTSKWYYEFSSSITSTAIALKKAGFGDIDFTSVTLGQAGQKAFPFDIENNVGSKHLKDTADLEDQWIHPGVYTLTIAGHSYGGGSYSAQTFAVPYPEPATWATMIGGIGVAGGMLRRRAKGKLAYA